MIPYIIQMVNPSDDIRNNNIFTYYECAEKSKLNEKIINFIIIFIDEFCSPEYGHNLQIISYSDFCNKFWKIATYSKYDWYYIFRIYYFENNWIEWKIEDNQEQIYKAYIEQCIAQN